MEIEAHMNKCNEVDQINKYKVKFLTEENIHNKSGHNLGFSELNLTKENQRYNHFVEIQNLEKFSFVFKIENYEPKNSLFSFGVVTKEIPKNLKGKIITDVSSNVFAGIVIPKLNKLYSKKTGLVEELRQNRVDLEAIQSVKVNYILVDNNYKKGYFFIS